MKKGQKLLLIPRPTIEFLTLSGFMRGEYLTWYDLYNAYLHLDNPPEKKIKVR